MRRVILNEFLSRMGSSLQSVMNDIFEEYKYYRKNGLFFGKGQPFFDYLCEYGDENFDGDYQWGSSRLTYTVDDDKVLKVAFNPKGIAQNKQEHFIYQQYSNYSIIPKCYGSYSYDLFLISENVFPCNYTDFEMATGVQWGSYKNKQEYDDWAEGNPLLNNDYTKGINDLEDGEDDYSDGSEPDDNVITDEQQDFLDSDENQYIIPPKRDRNGNIDADNSGVENPYPQTRMDLTRDKHFKPEYYKMYMNGNEISKNDVMYIGPRHQSKRRFAFDELIFYWKILQNGSQEYLDAIKEDIRYYQRYIDNNPFLKELDRFIKDSNCFINDLKQIANWGIANRDGKYQIVLLDAGLTPEKFRRLYIDNYSKQQRQ